MNVPVHGGDYTAGGGNLPSAITNRRRGAKTTKHEGARSHGRIRGPATGVPMESTFGRHGTAGDAQEAVYRMAIATSNAMPTELRIAATGRLLVDAGRTLSCLVNVVARSSSGDSASFLRRVVVKNVAGVVSLVGGVETVGVDQKDAGAAAWAVAITADDGSEVPGGYSLACGGAAE